MVSLQGGSKSKPCLCSLLGHSVTLEREQVCVCVCPCICYILCIKYSLYYLHVFPLRYSVANYASHHPTSHCSTFSFSGVIIHVSHENTFIVFVFKICFGTQNNKKCFFYAAYSSPGKQIARVQHCSYICMTKI